MTTDPTAHINFIQRIFGTSVSSIVINSLVLLGLIYLAYRFFVAPIIELILDPLDFRRLTNRRMVFIEVTPPAYSTKTPHATTQFMNVLHSLTLLRPRRHSMLRRKSTVSLETVGTREGGIRFVLQAEPKDIESVQQAISAYLPEVRAQIIEDYLPANLRGSLMELKQSRHFAFPLAKQDKLGEHDPMAYLTTAMTKLDANELMVSQIVITPSSSSYPSRVYNKLASGKEVPLHDNFLHFLVLFALGLVQIVINIVQAILGFFTIILGGSPPGQEPARQETPHQQRLTESMLEKLGQPLMHTTIRIFVSAGDSAAESRRLNELQAMLLSLKNPGYQALVMQSNGPRFMQRYRWFKFTHRLPSMFPEFSSLFSTSELADLYHFPFADAAQTENLVKSYSRTLPSPIVLKRHADANAFDVPLGRNHHHGTTIDIGLTAADRERHVYIIGGTGNGKTTMMLGSMIQDAKKGKGFAFVDPHGDAAETILRYVPQERINDVIYFNPSDFGYPIGLNLLELPVGLSGDELIHAKDLVTSAVISVFRKIFSEEDDGGHRIEYVLRNTIQTALTQPGSTLFTVFDLLNDPVYRKKVVTKLQDKDLKNFWQNEMGQAGDFQRVKMSAGITAKIGRFLFSASAKRILQQPKSTIDFDDILSSGKILICNFSKGLLGEDTSELFGITVLAKLQMAANRRARIKQVDRRPFYLYVDEFQNFATASFVQMMSEARKYQLFMTLAEQSTSQQKDQRMVQVILANVGTLICFRTGNPADESLLLPFFSPFIGPGEIANLPAYNFYVRISGINTQEPLSGETVVPPEEGSDELTRQLIEHSRAAYASKAVPVPEPIQTREAEVSSDKGPNTNSQAQKDNSVNPTKRRPQKKPVPVK